jgi:ATP-binding cassette, subfamily C, bacterial
MTDESWGTHFVRSLFFAYPRRSATAPSCPVLSGLAAGAWDFVCDLPQGIHAAVGERGAMPSGGQRQRIAFARGLVRKPALLILDEDTSALDPETEKAICATLQQLKGSMTIFAISHQQSLVLVADHLHILTRSGLQVCEPNEVEHWRMAY